MLVAHFVDDSYIVGGIIGKQVVILKIMIVFTSIYLILSLIVTL